MNLSFSNSNHQSDGLVFFGDSLFDNGNLSTILTPVEPFPDPFYSGGKASNGLVLSEAIAEGFGIDPDSIIPRFTVPYVNLFQENLYIDYAIAGATSGYYGSQGNQLNTLPIGLLSQVEQFITDFQTSSQTLPDRNFSKKNSSNLDGMMTVGSNDVFDVLLLDQLYGVIGTYWDNNDDQNLINTTADTIVSNIKSAVDSLGNTIDDLVILGLSSLGDVPFVRQVDQLMATQLSSLGYGSYDDFAGDTRDILTGIAVEVNQQLSNIYDNKTHNIKDVFVVDGIDVLSAALSDWQNSVGEFAITDISYLDYYSGITSLPSGLSVNSFAFIDGAHPSDGLNHFLANEIVSTITSEFNRYSLFS